MGDNGGSCGGGGGCVDLIIFAFRRVLDVYGWLNDFIKFSDIDDDDEGGNGDIVCTVVEMFGGNDRDEVTTDSCGWGDGGIVINVKSLENRLAE